MAETKKNPNFIQAGSGGPQGFRLAGFPKEFEKGFWDIFDKRFYTILLITWVILYAFALYMSNREWTMSEQAKERMKQSYLQNLYAEIITPEELPAEGEGEGLAGTGEVAGAAEEEEIAEQTQRLVGESSSDRVRRQRAGVGARRAKRSQMEQEAAGYGVLAALTASGGSGSGSLAYADILGEAGGSGSGLANASDLVAGTAALQAATGRGQRTRLAKGGGFGGEVGETGIDDLISGTGASGGTSVTRRGSIQLAQETQVTGTGAGSSQRDPEVIDAIINQNKSSVEYCYQSQLKLDPNLRGDIMLSFDILPTGKVGAVNIMNSTLNNSKVEQCIIRAVRRWSFPAQKGAQGIVTIRTKFIFG
ncbi:MAG: TonB family protein [Calditrichaeota bacterium]|nr:TonB family protein [Calditrichota bacterium]RQW07226.1 MAG: TonB family protein [Calditrichota bacterium]